MRLLRNVRTTLSGLVVAGVLVTVHPTTPAAASASGPRVSTTGATASRSIALGVDTRKSTGLTAQAAVTQAEDHIGHKLAFTRDFLLWDSPFPTSYENWLGARGTVPMISVKSRLSDGTPVPWSAVAAAAPGSALYQQIQGWADRVKAFGYPVYFTYNHEPEAATNNDLGTAQDYLAAWRKVHDVFAAEQVTNARFMWIMTSWAFKVPATDARYGWNWYPGDAYVDGIASDAYNWSDCRYPNGHWESLATILSGFMQFGAQHPTIPLWLTEFAGVEDPANPGRKAQWIQDAQTLLEQPAYSQIAGAAYFSQLQTGVPCGWPMESSTAATAALNAMAQDPYFQGQVLPASAAAPQPPATVSFVAATSTTANTATETVRVPAGVAAGNGLVLIASSAGPAALTAPAGWTRVTTASSPTMYGAVWQRVATGTDAASSVAVGFGAVTKGSVELLAYSGTSPVAPVATALGSTVETRASTLRTPALAGVGPGQVVLAYWAARTSVDTVLAPTGAVTSRSAETSTGGGRITSMAAEGDPTAAAGVTAAVSPDVSHGLTFGIALAPGT